MSFKLFECYKFLCECQGKEMTWEGLRLFKASLR